MKIKTLLILLAVLFTTHHTIIAQDDKFSFGFELVPNLAGVHFVDGVFAEPSNRLSLSFGTKLSYRLNQHWQLESGIQLLTKGHQYKRSGNELMWGTQHDGEGGFDPGIDTSEPALVGTTLTFRYSLYYLAVPLNLRYHFKENNTKGFYLRGGIASAYNVLNKTTTIIKDDEGTDRSRETDNNSNLKKINLNLNMGFGYAFLIKEKFQIGIEPRVEYMLLNTIAGEGSKSHLYSIGLATSFTIL